MKSSIMVAGKRRPFISLMSAPAANALSDPVSTIAAICGSASNASNWAPSSVMSWSHSAFSAAGRYSLISPTRSWVSTWIISAIRFPLGAVRFAHLCVRPQ